MKPLDHRTYLAAGCLVAKADWDRSMFGKARCNEAAKLHAPQGPDGMVRAKLLEPECPNGKAHGSDTAEEIRGSLETCSP